MSKNYKETKNDSLNNLKEDDLDEKLKFLDSTLSQLNTYETNQKEKVQQVQKQKQDLKYQEQLQQQNQAKSAKQYWEKMQKNNYLNSHLFQIDKQLTSILKNKEFQQNLHYQIKQIIKDFEKTYGINVPQLENIKNIDDFFQQSKNGSSNSVEFIDDYKKISRKGILNMVSNTNNDCKTIWTVINSKDNEHFKIIKLIRLFLLQTKNIINSPCFTIYNEMERNSTFALCAHSQQEKYIWLKHIELLKNDILINSIRI